MRYKIGDKLIFYTIKIKKVKQRFNKKHRKQKVKVYGEPFTVTYSEI